MDRIQDQTTRTALVIFLAAFVGAFVKRILELFWPPWLAMGVSFFVWWGSVWYFVFKHERRFPARRARSFPYPDF